jgi:hypothetical protein
VRGGCWGCWGCLASGRAAACQLHAPHSVRSSGCCCVGSAAAPATEPSHPSLQVPAAAAAAAKHPGGNGCGEEEDFMVLDAEGIGAMSMARNSEPRPRPRLLPPYDPLAGFSAPMPGTTAAAGSRAHKPQAQAQAQAQAQPPLSPSAPPPHIMSRQPAAAARAGAGPARQPRAGARAGATGRLAAAAAALAGAPPPWPSARSGSSLQEEVVHVRRLPCGLPNDACGVCVEGLP